MTDEAEVPLVKLKVANPVQSCISLKATGYYSRQLYQFGTHLMEMLLNPETLAGDRVTAVAPFVKVNS